MLTADGPQQAIERQALLAAAGNHRTDVLAAMTAAQQAATAANDAAKDALTKAAALKKQAADDLAAASNLEAQARQQASALEVQQTQLQAQLQAAQQTLYGLEGARAAAIAYQQQQAAAQAAADAAARARATSSTGGASNGRVSIRPVSVTTTSPGDSSTAQTAINAAKEYLGTMYAWGGGSMSGPSEGFGIDDGVVGFDCSGRPGTPTRKRGSPCRVSLAPSTPPSRR